MHYLAAAKGGSGNYTFLIVIVVLFGLLYFVMIRPQRNKQRQAQAMQSQVRPGQRVRTTAGMYATVVEADDSDVILEVAPGVQLRFLRRAIMDVLPDDDGTAAADTAGPEYAEPAATDDAAGSVGSDGQAAAGYQNGSAPDTATGSSPADSTAAGEHQAE
ncbi:MAG TPA: preprotein translocase subunit YajC [Streptosporangiaceae bacterium]|nr:preprotein translocase subunit YajC [Streptosporangiaceae bacterium]